MKSRRERMLDRLRAPKWRLVRVPAGALLLLGGIVGFLPLVGFWMVPLGLAILAIDIPTAGRLLRKLAAPFLLSLQRISMFAKEKVRRHDA